MVDSQGNHVALPAAHYAIDPDEDDSVDGRTIPLYRLHGVDHQDDLVSKLRERRSAFIDGASRFHLHELIGEGSQGLIMRVHDRDCRRDVALKTLHHKGCDLDEISRFIHEAQITAQLEHPGIVPVHDVGVLSDGTIFYTMKRVEGQNLADHLVERAGKAEHRFELLELFLRACEAIAFAHSRGVIHRDIKPRNIMVGSYGEVLVLDWGLAKVIGAPTRASQRMRSRNLPDSDGDIHRTLDGYTVGTPAYMSPEQARGSKQLIVDQRCDIYALGVVLYEVLSGSSPYKRGNVRSTLEQVSRGEWEPLNKKENVVGVSRRLIAIVHKAMASNVADRYQTVNELIADLHNELAGRQVGAYRENILESSLRHIRNHRRMVVSVLATVLVASVLFFTWNWRAQANQLAQVQGWFQEAQLHHAGGVQALEKARAEAHVLQRKEILQTAQEHLEKASQTYEGILKIYSNDAIATVELRQVRKNLADVAIEKKAEERIVEAKGFAQKAEELRVQGEMMNSESILSDAADQYQNALGIIPGDKALTEAYQAVVRKRDILEQQRKEKAIAEAKEEQKNQQAQKFADDAKASFLMGDHDKALALMQGAMALRTDQKDLDFQLRIAKSYSTLVTRKQQQERQQRADDFFRLIQAAVNDGKPNDAAAYLEQMRTVNPSDSRLNDGRDLIETVRRTLAEREADALLSQVDVFRAHVKFKSDELEATLFQLEKSKKHLLESGDVLVMDQLTLLEPRIEDLRKQVAKELADALTLLVKAETIAKDYPPVRKHFAAYYVESIKAAEIDGRTADAAVAEVLAGNYDDGSYASIIKGEVTVTCAADSPTISIAPAFHHGDQDSKRGGIALTLEPKNSATLRWGRYVVSNAAGVAQAREFLRGETYVISLPAPANVPVGTIFIPAGRTEGKLHRGPMVEGVASFALGRHEVTCGEYVEFLNDPTTLQRYEEEHAKGILRFVPRNSFDSPEPLWRQRTVPVWQKHPGEFLLEVRDGNMLVNERQPVTGISWDDAHDYIEWRRSRDHIEWRLPTAAEWTLAAQGGDGRAYPWGERFDPHACASGFDWQRWPRDLVVGGMPNDCSVQGVYDLAGSVSEFCADTITPGNNNTVGGLQSMMGGNFTDRLAERFTTTSRRACDRRMVFSGCGFRLAVTLPK